MEGKRIVITKKAHRCNGCGRKFPAGIAMQSWTFLDVEGNGWCTWYYCDVCQHVMQEIDVGDYDGVIYEDAAIEADREYWNKRRTEIEGA
jgi:hypothetical protein